MLHQMFLACQELGKYSYYTKCSLWHFVGLFGVYPLQKKDPHGSQCGEIWANSISEVGMGVRELPRVGLSPKTSQILFTILTSFILGRQPSLHTYIPGTSASVHFLTPLLSTLWSILPLEPLWSLQSTNCPGNKDPSVFTLTSRILKSLPRSTGSYGMQCLPLFPITSPVILPHSLPYRLCSWTHKIIATSRFLSPRFPLRVTFLHVLLLIAGFLIIEVATQMSLPRRCLTWPPN